MFYLFNRWLFVEIESKEGSKTAQLVIKQLQQMTTYRKFRKENTGIRLRNRERLFPVLPLVKKRKKRIKNECRPTDRRFF
jgi:23S rRNA G2069 N7-methylase RlmK/C1962 C5-methylase RlmI